MSQSPKKLTSISFWLSLLSVKRGFLFALSYVFGFILSASSWTRTQLPIFWVLLMAFGVLGSILFQALDYLGDAQVSRKLSKTTLVRLLGLTLLISGTYLFLFFVTTSFSQLLLASYLLLAALYFLPPLRWKDKAFLSSYALSFYLVPGLIGYWLGSYAFPSFLVMLGVIFWLAGHDALGQIGPAKNSDRLRPTFALLGESSTLLFVFANWLLFALIMQGHGWIFIGAFLYPALALLYMLSPKGSVEKSRWLARVLDVVSLSALLILALLQK